MRGISHVCCNAICHNSSRNSGNSSAGISMAMNGRIVERNKHLHSVEVITTTWQPTHPFHMISQKYQVTLKGTTLELVYILCITMYYIVIKVIRLFVHCKVLRKGCKCRYTVQYQYQRPDSVELQELCEWL